MRDMRTYLMMLSARSVMNFARHFTTAMLPGPTAPLIPYSDG